MQPADGTTVILLFMLLHPLTRSMLTLVAITFFFAVITFMFQL
jgi:hypothetical protein